MPKLSLLNAQNYRTRIKGIGFRGLVVTVGPYVFALLVGIFVNLIVSVAWHPSDAITLLISFATVFPALWLSKNHPQVVMGLWLVLVFVLGLLVLLSAYYVDFWNDVNWNPTAVGLGLGLISISIAVYALMTSQQSDKKMKAMANMEFLEKMAMIADYMHDIQQNKPVVPDRLYYDIRGAMHLTEYVDPEIKGNLNMKIEAMRDSVTGDPKYKQLVVRLNQLLDEDRSPPGIEPSTDGGGENGVTTV